MSTTALRSAKDRKNAFKIVCTAVLAALVSRGFSESNGPGIAYKTYKTVDIRKNVDAYLHLGDGICHSLNFMFMSEGRNVVSTVSCLIPIGSSYEKAYDQALEAAIKAHRNIEACFAVRFAKDDDQVVMNEESFTAPKTGQVCKTCGHSS